MITGQAPDGACQIALPCPLDSEGPHKSEREADRSVTSSSRSRKLLGRHVAEMIYA
jgi:hypothetical protein